MRSKMGTVHMASDYIYYLGILFYINFVPVAAPAYRSLQPDHSATSKLRIFIVNIVT